MGGGGGGRAKAPLKLITEINPVLFMCGMGMLYNVHDKVVGFVHYPSVICFGMKITVS